MITPITTFMTTLRLHTLSHFFLPLLLPAFLVASRALDKPTLGGNLYVTDQYEIIVVSVIPNEPNPLRVRCQSKDNDLGTHVLKTGENIHWSFRINIFYTTRYFCHFWWGSKQKSFDVFYYDTTARYCKKPGGHYTCLWIVRPEGFYLSNGNATWVKACDWN